MSFMIISVVIIFTITISIFHVNFFDFVYRNLNFILFPAKVCSFFVWLIFYIISSRKILHVYVHLFWECFLVSKMRNINFCSTTEFESINFKSYIVFYSDLFRCIIAQWYFALQKWMKFCSRTFTLQEYINWFFYFAMYH